VLQPQALCNHTDSVLFQARHITRGVTTIDNQTPKVFHEVITPSSVSPSEEDKYALPKGLASQLSWSDYWLASLQKNRVYHKARNRTHIVSRQKKGGFYEKNLYVKK
jgi:hypothetical protein